MIIVGANWAAISELVFNGGRENFCVFLENTSEVDDDDAVGEEIMLTTGFCWSVEE